METASLKNKIYLGLAFGLATGETFRRLAVKYFTPWIPYPVILALAILILLIGLFLPYWWNAYEKRKATALEQVKAWLEHLLIYALALDLTMFGWQKIEGLQMIVPLGVLDMPFSSFSGESLVWAFFKFSYSFTVGIALLQLLTAPLLLFAKTRLLALLLAIPMLVFVTSMDLFYQMPIGVLTHGIILLIGVSYLLLQDYERLKAFVLQPMPGLGKFSDNQPIKWIARSSLVVLPVVFHLLYEYPDKHPDLTGKYQVADLRVNGKTMKAEHPKDSVLTTVYLDLEDDAVFDFNDYRYRYIGTYTLDEKTDSFEIHWRYPSNRLDPFKGKLSKEKDDFLLEGEMDGKKYKMKLGKVTH